MKKLVVYFANGMKTEMDPEKTAFANNSTDLDALRHVLYQGEATVNWANVSFMRIKEENEGGEEE